MARYRVLQKSFINDAIVEEGEIVEYGGEAGANLGLVDAKQAKGGAADTPLPDLLG